MKEKNQDDLIQATEKNPHTDLLFIAMGKTEGDVFLRGNQGFGLCYETFGQRNQEGTRSHESRAWGRV